MTSHHTGNPLQVEMEWQSPLPRSHIQRYWVAEATHEELSEKSGLLPKFEIYVCADPKTSQQWTLLMSKRGEASTLQASFPRSWILAFFDEQAIYIYQDAGE